MRALRQGDQLSMGEFKKDALEELELDFRMSCRVRWTEKAL